MSSSSADLDFVAFAGNPSLPRPPRDPFHRAPPVISRIDTAFRKGEGLAAEGETAQEEGLREGTLVEQEEWF